MNLRIYKKKAKLAREILIADHGFRPSDFWMPGLNNDDNEICTSESKDPVRDSIPHRKGVPSYLPAKLDYWGEANEPKCCIDMVHEVIWWDVFGDSYIRKELASEAAQ